MIKLRINDKPISLTLSQAIDLYDQLLKQLPTAITSSDVKMITTAAAIELARTEGKHLPATTLRTALDAGAIPGVQKPAGRRLLPENEFRKWLVNYKSKG